MNTIMRETMWTPEVRAAREYVRKRSEESWQNSSRVEKAMQLASWWIKKSCSSFDVTARCLLAFQIYTSQVDFETLRKELGETNQ